MFLLTLLINLMCPCRIKFRIKLLALALCFFDFVFTWVQTYLQLWVARLHCKLMNESQKRHDTSGWLIDNFQTCQTFFNCLLSDRDLEVNAEDWFRPVCLKSKSEINCRSIHLRNRSLTFYPTVSSSHKYKFHSSSPSLLTIAVNQSFI